MVNPKDISKIMIREILERFKGNKDFKDVKFDGDIDNAYIKIYGLVGYIKGKYKELKFSIPIIGDRRGIYIKLNRKMYLDAFTNVRFNNNTKTYKLTKKGRMIIDNILNSIIESYKSLKEV